MNSEKILWEEFNKLGPGLDYFINLTSITPIHFCIGTMNGEPQRYHINRLEAGTKDNVLLSYIEIDFLNLTSIDDNHDYYSGQRLIFDKDKFSKGFFIKDEEGPEYIHRVKYPFEGLDSNKPPMSETMLECFSVLGKQVSSLKKSLDNCLKIIIPTQLQFKYILNMLS